MTSPGWDVLVPLKGPARAKSRLRTLAPEPRRALAQAMAIDTVSAVLGSPLTRRVHVICDDRGLGEAVGGLGAEVIVHRRAPAGLNAALADTARRLGVPARSQPAAVVLGDLPALRGADLACLLGRAGAHDRAVVADGEGTGTTVLTVTAGPLRPRFGPSSLRRHLADGAALLAAPPGVRRDIDLLEDLRGLWDIGPGPRTVAVLRMWGVDVPGGSPGSLDALPA